ncbi:MAG: twin-arginine translocase subunit TatC [Dehalococcoidia bacterium]|nr:MAG: twin-arginine translocase subunit TatC [Dehalococcoidia bacterium]
MTSALDRARQKASEATGGEMTLLEHLLELRSRMMWSALAVAAGMIAFFIPPVGFGVIGWLLAPARETVPDFRPQYIEPMENIAVYFRVALLGGVTVAMPMLVFQLLGFVAPALTKSEKRWLFPIMFLATVAFIGGLAFGYWVVLPVTLGFLLSFGNDIAQADWRIGNYIGFVTRILLVMGFVFETPLLVMGLAKAGVVTAKKLLGWWRFAVVAAFLVAAIVTPTIDPITQSLVGGPIVVLYFVGIGLAWLVRRE